MNSTITTDTTPKTDIEVLEDDLYTALCIIAVLVKRAGGTTTITNEELDALYGAHMAKMMIAKDTMLLTLVDVTTANRSLQ